MTSLARVKQSNSIAMRWIRSRRRATAGKRGDRIFPFNLITIELAADNAERKAVLETLFDPGQLGDDIRATLKEERVTPPADLTVAIKFPESALVEMRVICERDKSEAAPPAASVSACAGSRRTAPGAPPDRLPAFLPQRNFHSNGPASILGARRRSPIRWAGRSGGMNCFFPEQAHEANPSVSRAHAHIRFDASSGEWRIFDDGSSIGTTLFREGRRIDVPAHAGRGVALRAGDEIYLGQVRLQFESGAPLNSARS